MTKITKFLAMWDMNGLEALIDVSAAEQAAVISTLKGEPIAWKNPIHGMILRARFNSQRRYEIYVFESELDEVSVRHMFEHDAQVIVNGIRKVGTQLYSDRQKKNPVIL